MVYKNSRTFVLVFMALCLPAVSFSSVVYNPLSLNVVENNTGIAVEGMGLTDDTLQTVYGAGGGQVTIPHVRWSDAPGTGARLSSTGNNHDFTFTGSYTGDRAVGEIRMYTEHQTNDKRFYDFDLYYSTTAASTTFTKFLTLTDLSTVIKGMEIIITDFNGQIDDVYTIRMYTRGGAVLGQTYWSEVDINLVAPGPDCSSYYAGDTNGDLRVDLVDLSNISANFSETDPAVFGCADLSGSGDVGVDDVQILAANWTNDYSSMVAVIPSAASVPQYSLLTMDINSTSAYSDPYNPADIRVDAVITAPDLTEIILPCFYKSGTSGNSQWEARFTPQQAGQYSYRVKVYLSDLLDGISDVFTLESTVSAEDGFVHMNPSSYYTFKHDSGRRFRGVGENIGWEGEGGYSYDDLYPLLNANGCNFVRSWLITPKDPPTGLEWNNLGSYNQTAASRLDQVFDLAEQYGIYLMLSIDHHNLFISGGGTSVWANSPYNSANGGPCATPTDFFTNATAKDYYKRKLRYLVARWGYSPQLCVWEFFNEVDHVVEQSGVSITNVSNWHGEMASYLKSIDPYGHIVTTSLSHNNYSALWNLANMDFTQRHLYGSTSGMYSTTTSYESSYNKPFVSGEFSLYWQGPWAIGTPTEYRRELHLGLWRGMFSPTPILPMTWWWNYHDSWGDWDVFNAAANFQAQMLVNDADVIQEASVNAGASVEEMGLKAGNDIYLWLKNTSTTSSISSITVSVTSVANGTYDVYLYDTYNSTYAAPVPVTVSSGTLGFVISTMTADQDVAYKIIKN